MTRGGSISSTVDPATTWATWWLSIFDILSSEQPDIWESLSLGSWRPAFGSPAAGRLVLQHLPTQLFQLRTNHIQSLGPQLREPVFFAAVNGCGTCVHGFNPAVTLHAAQ